MYVTYFELFDRRSALLSDGAVCRRIALPSVRWDDFSALEARKGMANAVAHLSDTVVCPSLDVKDIDFRENYRLNRDDMRGGAVSSITESASNSLAIYSQLASRFIPSCLSLAQFWPATTTSVPASPFLVLSPPSPFSSSKFARFVRTGGLVQVSPSVISNKRLELTYSSACIK